MLEFKFEEGLGAVETILGTRSRPPSRPTEYEVCWNWSTLLNLMLESWKSPYDFFSRSMVLIADTL